MRGRPNGSSVQTRPLTRHRIAGLVTAALLTLAAAELAFAQTTQFR